MRRPVASILEIYNGRILTVGTGHRADEFGSSVLAADSQPVNELDRAPKGMEYFGSSGINPWQTF
jgi:hypothetical protein